MGVWGLIPILCFFLTGGFAHADTSSVAARALKSLQVKECESGQCWQDLFKNLSEQAQTSLAAIQAYIARMEETEEHSGQVLDQDAEGIKAALNFRMKRARETLSQCESLTRGGGKIQHLIVLGHRFAKDGSNFNIVAEEIRQQKIAELCGGKVGAVRKECESQVVIVEDINKGDLAAFLDLLPPGSVLSASYVGHGIENAIGVGGRNVLLPFDWRPGLKISKDDWLEYNQGMLYAEDLNKDFGQSMVRVLAPRSNMDIYACKAGTDFGPRAADRFGASVRASVKNMHFEWFPPKGDPIRADPGVEPPKGSFLKLVPDDGGIYGPVGPPGILPVPTQGAATLASMDQATQNVTVRLMKGSDTGPIWLPGYRKAIFFSDRERKFLNDALGSLADVHEGIWRDPKIGYIEIMEALNAKVLPYRGKPRERLDMLVSKLRMCIDESVRLYYQ